MMWFTEHLILKCHGVSCLVASSHTLINEQLSVLASEFGNMTSETAAKRHDVFILLFFVMILSGSSTWCQQITYESTCISAEKDTLGY